MDPGEKQKSIIRQNLESFTVKPVKNNLSKGERKALKDLQNDTSIIIKEADKGNAVCIMDTEYYSQKISEMLQDNSIYQEIGDNNNEKVIRKIHELLKKFDGCIKEKERDYIMNFEYKESNFYGLPKIHKCKSIKEEIEKSNSEYIILKTPPDLTFHPIVAGPVSPTSRLSEYIDCIIKHLPQSTKSYVRDDIDFLSKLNRNLPSEQQHRLITLDVESLYTNVNHALRINAIYEVLDKEI